MQKKIQATENISQSIWDAFLLGDPNAFSKIYNIYSDMMFAYGSCLTDDSELVKDIIHDIFIKIYNNRATIQSTNLKFYLLRSVKNEIYCVLRNKKDICQVEEENLHFSPEYSAEDLYIENEQEQFMHKKILTLLDSLTSRQREVIYCRYMEGLSINEIASLMEMNYQSVQNLMQRSMDHLRKIYTDRPASPHTETEKANYNNKEGNKKKDCLFFFYQRLNEAILQYFSKQELTINYF